MDFARRPWPTDSVERLNATRSNHRDWKLCVIAVAQGQQAEELLTRGPDSESPIEKSQAAQLKSFLMLTSHKSFRQAIASKTAFQAFSFLNDHAPQSSIYEVDASTQVPPMDTFPSPAEYVAAHYERHDKLLTADENHYLSS